MDNSECVLKEPTLAVSAARSHAVLRASLFPLKASRILFRLVGARSWRLKACQLLKHEAHDSFRLVVLRDSRYVPCGERRESRKEPHPYLYKCRPLLPNELGPDCSRDE